MSKAIYVFLLAVGITASTLGCSVTDNLQATSEPSLASSVSEASSSLQENPASAPDTDALNEFQSELESADLSDSEDLYNEIDKVIKQYQNGEITPNERFDTLPKDFTFPDSWTIGDLGISRREVMGDYRAVLVSSDSKYEMVLISNNFTFMFSDGTSTGGEFVVTDVEFTKGGYQV